MSLLLNEEEVHNGHILNAIVFLKTSTMNCIANAQRDFSIPYHTFWSMYMRIRPLLRREIAFPVIIFLQGGNFWFYHFIFRPCFAF